MNPYDYKRQQARYSVAAPRKAVRRAPAVPDNWDTTQTDFSKYKLTPQELALRRAYRAPKYRYNEPLVSTVYHASDYIGHLYNSEDDQDGEVRKQLTEVLRERYRTQNSADFVSEAVLAELDELKRKVAELSKPSAYQYPQAQRPALGQAAYRQSYSAQNGRDQNLEEEPEPQLTDVNETLLRQVNELTDRLVKVYMYYNELADVCAALKVENKELVQQLKNVQADVSSCKHLGEAQELAELDEVLERMKLF